MNGNYYYLLTALIFLSSSYIHAQERDAVSGTYSDAANSTMLQIKKVGDEYHGMVQEMSGGYAFQASMQEKELKGYVFSNGVRAPFSATFDSNNLTFEAGGQQVVYIKRYASHQLTDVDLRPYFNYRQTLDPQNETSESTTNPSKNSVTGFAANIAGGRLVLYRSASIFSPSTASSMTFIHFCSNGTFYSTTDASFSVEGDYGANAHGISRGNNAGKWKVGQQNGQEVLVMQYSDGSQEVSELTPQRLRQGRWKQGSTQYAFEAGKSACK